MAELEGRVVGFADLCDGGLLDMLFVHPDARGRGVARAFVSAVFDHARQARMSRIDTHASRPARPVFESLGFVVDQENPDNRVRDVRVPNCDMPIDLSEGDEQPISGGRHVVSSYASRPAEEPPSPRRRDRST
ncbi:GNAT family N-acetyltransferase [Kocuria sp. p3-SID1433]|nr:MULTISPECIES: GNAT family N-acetyltransferase [unclassified Kocuria]MCT1601411.1 GNAT family N-acetyltransferase [Kocuria sp. p3-SID1428]MCT2179251.1 GNAT family N-acetyltransferase [Kocuria sp. p3-SID1433]